MADYAKLIDDEKSRKSPDGCARRGTAGAISTEQSHLARAVVVGVQQTNQSL
jgi:hypothetical protein